MFSTKSTISFPNTLANQVQSLKSASGQPRQGSQSPNPVLTAGSATLPFHVVNPAVIVKQSSDVSTRAVVTFQRPVHDGLFVDASVYVSGYQGNPQPVKVATGQSPISFSLNNTGESLVFHVQANGPTGSAPLNSAPTTTAKLIATNLATVTTPEGNGTFEATFLNTPDQSRIRYVVPKWSTTSVQYDVPQNWIAPTNSGNGSFTFAVIQPTTTSTSLMKLTTQATSGFLAAWQGGVLAITLGLVESTALSMSTYTSASVRYFIGLFDSIAGVGGGLLDTDTPNQNGCYWRYSTNAGDTTWQACCSTDSAHITTVDTGVPVDASGALHKFEIRTDQGNPGVVKFVYDDTQTAIINTNVPAATVFMSYYGYGEALSATAVSLGMNGMKAIFF